MSKDNVLEGGGGMIQEEQRTRRKSHCVIRLPVWAK